MNLCVIGLGSMGKRRLRLLKRIELVNSIYGVDTQERRRVEVSNELKVDCYTSIEEVLNTNQIDGVVICTPPLTHATIISKCLSLNLHVFTEINLVDDNYDQLIQLAEENNKVLFLSSTFLYRKEIQYIKKTINSNPTNYMYHVGQYLPDWHPWESYKDFFVGDKKTNACREIFAIELPWIIDVFGDIVNFKLFKKKTTQLDIDYDDTYTLIVEHQNGTIGSLNINVVSRIAERRLYVYDEKLALSWNGTPDTLIEFDFEKCKEVSIDTYTQTEHDSHYAKNIIEDAYLHELENFIQVILGKETAKYSFEKDKNILNFINQLEESNE